MPSKKKVIVVPQPLSLTSITIYCPYLGKEVIFPKDKIHWSGSSQECETCGSHGEVKLFIYECECGKNHDLTVDSW